MAAIEITLIYDNNYISFPASSTYNFREIFMDSGIIDDIGIDGYGNKMFYEYDPLSNNYIPINMDHGHIEAGKGYCLNMSSMFPNPIVYDGTEYSITFDQFKSHIIKGWNLLGVGKDVIIPTSWCKILDPISMTPVTILEPKHSYLVNSDECIMSQHGYATTIAIVASTLVSFAILKQFKVL